MVKHINKIERIIGGLKFAVTIILIFSIMMTIGTFVESYYGTDFANRLIYKTPLFMFIQFLMFLSILFATFLRLPPKKRLYGFYVIHTGLITIGIGSFVTYIAGIDGTIHLPPMSPNRLIVLNEDVVEISIPDKNIRTSAKMPYSAFGKDLDLKYKDIEIKRYVPFAEKELIWTRSKNKYTDRDIHSSTYFIANSNVSETFTLSLHPEAVEFKASATLGPLNINYLPKTMGKCFLLKNPSKLILWNTKTSECFTPEQKKIKIRKTSTGKRFFVYKEKDKVFSFLPDISPWALDTNLQPIQSATVKVFSKGFFEKKPHLFVFGDSVAFFDKDEKKWFLKEFNNKKVELPWMGLELNLVKHSNEKYPSYFPKEVLPIQENSSVIYGSSKAALIKVRDEEYWITDDRPLAVLIDGVKHQVYLTKNSLTLPFEFTLTKFKMDKDPGTNSPASYESFVNVFTKTGNFPAHVYMNNPLKHEGFTFYQASYSQDPKTGQYSSTLSVNVDQGRPIKYLGSLLLVFGSMWHYLLNRRTRRKEKDILGLEDNN